MVSVLGYSEVRFIIIVCLSIITQVFLGIKFILRRVVRVICFYIYYLICYSFSIILFHLIVVMSVFILM